MTYGGATYGGSAYGSTTTLEEGETGTATATLTATTETAATGETTATADPQITVRGTVTSLEDVVATASSTTTATGTLTDATATSAPVEWRVTVDEETVEQDVYDVEVEDTANPFGNYAVLKIDDAKGAKFDRYSRGTRVDVAVSDTAGISYTERFTGFVVERRELDQDGADALEVEAYSFDQFLRNNKVTNDQSGKFIVDILEDIITTDTPVSWNAAKVTVGDSQKLTRSYRGEPVEEVLRDIAFKSESEDFGVDDDLDFFFRPQEAEHIDRGIDDTQWFNYDIPELGKEVRNEVEVWFDDGDRSVVIDDGQDKLDLQDSLNLPDPGTQRAEIQRPDITTISDAEAEGRKYLQFRNSTLSGTITTYGLYDATPGDTIDIQITERGIDSEFRIAAINYQWGKDATRITIVEKRGEQDDILYRLSGTVDRLEMQGANRDAPSNRITTTQANAVITPLLDADGSTPANIKLTNAGLNAIRDGWRGDGNPNVTTITVGDDGSNLSRSNTSLQSQTNSTTTAQAFGNSKSVSFSGTITQSDVAEVGIETSTGTLVARAVFETPVNLDGTVAWAFTASNDANVDRSVLTDTGQTAVRDILADNDPDIPAQYAYGSGAQLPAESDASLETPVTTADLTEVLIQSASTTSDFDGITSFSDTTPLSTDGDSLSLLQTSFTTEAEFYDAAENPGPATGGDYSNGEFVALGTASPQSYEWQFTTAYTIPASSFDIGVRFSSDTGANLTWYLDGEQVSQYSPATTGISWANDIISTFGTSPSSDVEAGTHTLRVEANDTSGGWQLDLVQPYDNRFSYTYDDTLDATDGYLDGPELYPSSLTQDFNAATTNRNVTEASFDLTANNTDNNFAVELSNDGSTYQTVSNSNAGSVTFSSPNTDVDSRVTLGQYGSRTDATPLTGFNGQSISEWDLFANPDAVVPDGNGIALTTAVIPANTIVSNTLSEAGLLDANGDLLTRHVFAEFDVLTDQTVRSAETTRFRNPE